MKKLLNWAEAQCSEDNAYIAPDAQVLCVTAKSNTMQVLKSSDTEGFGDDEEGEW